MSKRTSFETPPDLLPPRRRPFVALDVPTAEEMLRPAIGECRINSLVPLTLGMLNSNYRVAVEGGRLDLVLRIHTNEAEGCRIEADVLQLVGGRVPAPTVLYSDAAGVLTGRSYSVRTWISGMTLRDVLARSGERDAAALGVALGAVAARISEFRFDEHGLFGPGLSIDTKFGGVRDAVTEFVERSLKERGAGERLGGRVASVLDALKRHGHLLDALVAPFSLVQGDLNPGNVIVGLTDGEWEVRGVLDWEFAMSGPALADLAVLLRGHRDERDPFTAGVLGAFRQTDAGVQTEWRRTTALLDLVNLCDRLDDPPEDPGVVRELVNGVEEIVDSLGHSSPRGTVRSV